MHARVIDQLALRLRVIMHMSSGKDESKRSRSVVWSSELKKKKLHARCLVQSSLASCSTAAGGGGVVIVTATFEISTARSLTYCAMAAADSA
jgi:hypothetical protein